MIIPEGGERRSRPEPLPTPSRPNATILFLNKYTGSVMYAISEVGIIRYITPSEIAFVDHNGHIRSASITAEEKLEIDWNR